MAVSSKTSRPRRAPLIIAVLSYNRPECLAQVLASLAPQLKPGDRTALFQDGAWNPYSERTKADPAATAANIAVFRELIPTGEVFASPVNLGIAGNYRRAEQYVFEALGAPAALFLEDDLELSPHYLAVTAELLALAQADARIGYVSAYGDLWASLAEQRRKAGRVIPMHENWGAALTRRSWDLQRPFRERYWTLVDGADYSRRNHDLIRRFYADLGYCCWITSQDASRWIACVEADLVRVTTATCHARYIGVTGEHGTIEHYKRGRFADTIMARSRKPLIAPTDQEIAQWLATERHRYRVEYTHPYLV